MHVHVLNTGVLILPHQDMPALSVAVQARNQHSMQTADQAVALVNEWHDISVEDALYMLSGAFKHPAIRDAAVRVLKARASDEKLLELMNQLVLCVRHDSPQNMCPLAGAARLPLARHVHAAMVCLCSFALAKQNHSWMPAKRTIRRAV
jgi:Phosphoinositide 3-kinase family, accessory domain (PIK domain)